MTTSYLFLLSFVCLLTGFSEATQRNHIIIAPDNVAPNTMEATCQEQCYSLQHVLTHPDRFFTSNTTIEVLPGQYVVNESFGNIEIEGIEHFAMIGMDGENGSIIHCTSFGTLGLYFRNVKNVSITSIHLSHCDGNEPEDRGSCHATAAQLIPEMSYLDIYIDPPYPQFDKCTLVFITSSDISVSKVTVDHADGIGLLVIGVKHRFQLSESVFSHNKINSMIITMLWQNYLESTQAEYRITDSIFAYGNYTSESETASGLNIFFAHEGIGIVSVSLSNVTLSYNRAQEGNLLFAIANCDWEKKSHHDKGQTLVKISDLVSEARGDKYSNKGLVVTTWNQICNSLERRDKVNFTVDGINFIRSCTELKLYFDYLLMSHTVVEEASCTCDYAVSIVPEFMLIYQLLQTYDRYTGGQRYLVENLSVMNSCGRVSPLMQIADSNVIFHGSSNFLNNNGTVFFQYSVITFNGSVTVSNSSSRQSPFRAEDSSLAVYGKILFENNVGEQCGGLTLIRCKLYMYVEESNTSKAKMTFKGNQGDNGGGLALYDGSKLYGNCRLQFENNVAQHYGGAMFLDDASYRGGKFYNKFVLQCFQYWVPSYDSIDFTNNTAMVSGNALYGGWIDFCSEPEETSLFEEKKPLNTITINNTGEHLSMVSSNPSRTCICMNSIPQCNITEYKYEQPLSPGQSFHIEVVAVGQRFGTVPSIVYAAYVNTSVKVDEIQHVQNVERHCTTLNYTIRSSNMNSEEILQLTVEKKFIPEPDYRRYDKEQLLVFDQLSIIVTISKCPLGYSFDSVLSTCICQETLVRNDIECFIQNQTVIRRNQMWINATFIHTDSKISNPGVILHHNCPFDYCKNLNQQYLDLQYPNDQCAFGRSGILCGECPQNYSHVFGTSRCKECSNLWTVLVLSLFILTGIGLVALLIILNLTVSVGTINGLIFYAHIVRANQAAFFPPQMTNTFLSWFIAWLNLDLGIEMCFFDGLDAYTKTWLQFLFPLYIWVLVTFIIVSSHYSTFAARISGTNAVQVLATLFLMSYAKMLRITITIFSFTTLVYPDGYQRRVWLYDGNVDYLKGKHIPLFIAALILLIFLSIPYTLVLLTIQWLRLLPSYKVLFWVRKFMPLFDAYTGVYKRAHGYWTGLLLLVRVGLFAVFALNVLGDPSINLLAVAATTFCIITYLALFGGVYRQRYLNFIEYSYLLNLGIVSAVTAYTRLVEHTQEMIIQTSVGIALSTFILIVIYHAYQQFGSTHKGGLCVAKFITPLLDKFKSVKEASSAIIAQPTPRNKPEATHSSIELKEPLLID